MLNTALCIILMVLFCTIHITQADDQNCMNKATKQIPVNVIGDNPNKILTFVRDDPGYAKNLECKWELRANDYSKPRQMLLNVRNVDFDQSPTEDQCNRSAVDVFNFTFSGQSNKNQVKSQKWCSNFNVPSTKKLMLANLWNASNYLTVEFKSDNKQVRSDAKGVEMDVLIMSEDYCHRSMLFHNGYCYLITNDRLTFTEAYEVSKSLLGNLATFSDKDSLDQFVKSNNDRASMFPFSPPLKFDQWIWIGHCKGNGKSAAQYRDSSNNCTEAESTLPLPLDLACPDCSRIAIQVSSSGVISAACMNANESLPALIRVKQIPATVGDMHPRLFETCPQVCDVPASCWSPPESWWWWWIPIVFLGLLIIGAGIGLWQVRVMNSRNRRKRAAAERAKEGKDSGVPLRAANA